MYILKGEKPAWFDLNFLSRPDVNYNDSKSLVDEINRLKLEKADLAVICNISLGAIGKNLDFVEDPLGN